MLKLGSPGVGILSLSGLHKSGPSQRITRNSSRGATLVWMAKSPPEKKGPPEVRVHPMDLKLGDRLADERSEWQVIGRPYTTAGGKTAHVRVESMKQPGVTEIRSWGAHELVSVKRGSDGEPPR